MINLVEVEYIHSILIDKYGGSKGIRDLPGLDAAINRPFATFDSQDLYPTTLEKAAAILESLIINHPFVDGNKRIAYAIARIVLLRGGYTLSCSEDEKYNFVISASMGKVRYDEILDWLRLHASKLP